MNNLSNSPYTRRQCFQKRGRIKLPHFRRNRFTVDPRPDAARVRRRRRPLIALASPPAPGARRNHGRTCVQRERLFGMFAGDGEKNDAVL
ncbi:hypothetical protein EVAR_26956_1 [Eumeta japonica]|uniref:Uncharacterized protein n=1 Tax=Eumeta variegata TaxID=151549 RepID=A0A4C1VKY7_EUMVA|nr:hypothetical protein EVAR_26956_1 [Eumeta japonica]